MGKLEKYTSYKESGVEWIGKIPKHWEISKLGTCLKPISIKNKPGLPLLSVTREQGVILRDVDDKDSNHNFIPDDLSPYKMVEKGQFAMNKMKAWQGSYGISDYTGIVSPAYYIFELNGIEPTFFHKAIRSSVYVPFFIKASDGVRIGQWDLSKSRMKEIPFYIPPKEEQTKIASFLDEKTTQIDEVISQKEKLITLLKERKQITINEAATKGLDKDVEFIDSGVEWIGKIPKHWEVIKFKHLFYEKKKTHDMSLNCGSISFGKVVEKDDEKIPVSTKASYQVLNKGEFLINPLNLNYDLKSLRIGLSDLDVVVSSGYIIIKNREKMNKVYFNWLLHRYDIAFMKTLGAGVRQTLNYRDIGETLLVNPPAEEQEQIAEYIETQTAKIDKAIELQKNHIAKLKEYKASLIDNVVTGKVRVA